jgi:hypothetical protein
VTAIQAGDERRAQDWLFSESPDPRFDIALKRHNWRVRDLDVWYCADCGTTIFDDDSSCAAAPVSSPPSSVKVDGSVGNAHVAGQVPEEG